MPIASTVNVERIAGLNIAVSAPLSFARKYFCGASSTSVYYLTIAKYSWKTLVVRLKTTNTVKVLLSESFHIYSILLKVNKQDV